MVSGSRKQGKGEGKPKFNKLKFAVPGKGAQKGGGRKVSKG